MSEYQYYEFLALDRPLDDAARQELRASSSRARITAASFTNSYQWFLSNVEYVGLKVADRNLIIDIHLNEVDLDEEDDFAAFLNLVQAAAERAADTPPPADEVRTIISALPDHDRVEMLMRLFEGDPHVAM
ncbi:protein of unknown function [Rhodovastum atsumiense]|uniref:hypothetical protein n=1 Tax=Rhodovastum atsumiense TaxID=504468 RepID=UPI00193B69BF|nr:hypothetical protein [Rhodovastum atsumiense]CAH2603784.1 protein of unknown function [Rhodovastum atsumiense]